MDVQKTIQLVKKAQSGDKKALAALFEAHYSDIYFFALKTLKDEDLACDITQDTSIEIIKHINDLKEPAAFSGWAKKIAYSRCTRHFSKKTEVLVEEDEDGNSVFTNVAEENEEFLPEKMMEKEEFRKSIRGIVEELSEDLRATTMLFYFDEHSVREVAEIQGISEGTVKSRLSYARKAMKKGVEDYEKKHNTKLHAIPLFPLFGWLFGEEKKAGVPAAAAARIAEGVTAGSGIAVTVAKSGAHVATAGIIAKLAALPLAAKIAIPVIIAALLIGGIGAALSLGNDAPSNGDDVAVNASADANVSEDSSAESFEESSAEVSEDSSAEVSEESSAEVSEDSSAESSEESSAESSEESAYVNTEEIMELGEVIANGILRDYVYCTNNRDSYADNLNKLACWLMEMTPYTENDYNQRCFKVADMQAAAEEYFGASCDFTTCDLYNPSTDLVEILVTNDAFYKTTATGVEEGADGTYLVRIKTVGVNSSKEGDGVVTLEEADGRFVFVSLESELGHQYELTETVYPTKTADGSKQYGCTTCGTEKSDPYTFDAFVKEAATKLAFIDDGCYFENYTGYNLEFIFEFTPFTVTASDFLRRIYKVSDLNKTAKRYFNTTVDWSTVSGYDSASDSVAYDKDAMGCFEYHWTVTEFTVNSDNTCSVVLEKHYCPPCVYYINEIETYETMVFNITENGIQPVSYQPIHNFGHWRPKEMPTLSSEYVTAERLCYDCGFAHTKKFYDSDQYKCLAESLISENIRPDIANWTVEDAIYSLYWGPFDIEITKGVDESGTEINVITLEEFESKCLYYTNQSPDWSAVTADGWSYERWTYDAQRQAIVCRAAGMGPGDCQGSALNCMYSAEDGTYAVKFSYDDSTELDGKIVLMPLEDRTVLVDFERYW